MKRLCLILSLLIAVGCSSITFDPPVPFKEGGSKMIIIPFRQGDHIHHFESPKGREIAERMAALINKNARKGTYKIVHISAISKEMMEELRNSRPDKIDWAKVGRAAEADLVFSGNITKFEVQKPGDVNLFAGTCKVNVFVIGSEDNSRLYDQSHMVRHPEGKFELPFDIDSDASKMRHQLILKTAYTCAKPFYPGVEKAEN
ncbi:MAG: hypothetical protein E3J72_17915 [Planctomycetota bacterium]|nr:MAG: hypothetical protein E3J72_17915 [Planctomycetota bacterium]